MSILTQPPAEIPPTTTKEEQLHTAAQRQINRVWEYTQMIIATSVTFCCLYVGASLALRDSKILIPIEVFPLFILAAAFFLVIGFYFGRTNHARIGDPVAGKIEDKIDSR